MKRQMNLKISYNWISLKLVAIIVVVFILQIAFPITEKFALVSALVLYKPWLLITHIFLHGGIEHLLYNMFALALFGTILERIISGKKFLILFFASGLIAAVGSVIFYPASIGASGAIFGVLGCLALLRPKMTVYVGWIPMPMAMAAVVWAVGDLLGMFAPSGVANAAHLFGLAFGLIFGFSLMKQFGDISFKTKKKTDKEVSDKEIDDWESRWM